MQRAGPGLFGLPGSLLSPLASLAMPVSHHHKQRTTPANTKWMFGPVVFRCSGCAHNVEDLSSRSAEAAHCDYPGGPLIRACALASGPQYRTMPVGAITAGPWYLALPSERGAARRRRTKEVGTAAVRQQSHQALDKCCFPVPATAASVPEQSLKIRVLPGGCGRAGDSPSPQVC